MKNKFFMVNIQANNNSFVIYSVSQLPFVKNHTEVTISGAYTHQYANLYVQERR